MVCSFVSRKETTVGRHSISVYWQIEKNAVKHKSTQWWLYEGKNTSKHFTFKYHCAILSKLFGDWELSQFRSKVWKKMVRNLTIILKRIRTARYTIHEVAKKIKHHDNSWSPRNCQAIGNGKFQYCDRRKFPFTFYWWGFRPVRFLSKVVKTRKQNVSKRPCFIALHLSYEIPANSHENTSG